MIIQHNTGKAELCFVKLPESKSGIEVTIHGNERFLNVWGVEDIKLPSGNWQIVGNPFEITIEVIRDIVPEMRDSEYPFEVQDITDTWKDLLDKWRIYHTNPYNEDRMSIEFHYNDGKASKKDLDGIHDKWEDAQERTGSFILLKKIA